MLEPTDTKKKKKMKPFPIRNQETCRPNKIIKKQKAERREKSGERRRGAAANTRDLFAGSGEPPLRGQAKRPSPEAHPR